ncbi:OsmC family protein [Amycolatopsis anabasis]|uniref:OsmC family protein n=1 Tax=Amycolatopsis anabasis TaxID=1840409 RepID=UPI00131D3B57|nr:OsmC family protein [Amycolatopsis anabasis]
MSLTTVIEGTRQALDADPRNGAVQFSVTHELVAGSNTTVDVRVREHAFTVDEPPTLGGTDTAANPVEYALASLGSCQVVTYQFWAAKLGLPLESIRVTVEGDLDLHGFFGFSETTRAGFSGVRVHVDLTGPADPARYEELKRQVDEHCPVLDLFRNPTPVTTNLAP